MSANEQAATPETDAEVCEFTPSANPNYDGPHEWVEVKHARKLERERNELKADNAQFKTTLCAILAELNEQLGDGPFDVPALVHRLKNQRDDARIERDGMIAAVEHHSKMEMRMMVERDNARTIQHAEKTILIAEIKAHTKTKTERDEALAEVERLKDSGAI